MPSEEDIEEILDRIRPSLRGHGGDISLVGIDVKSSQVRVKLLGACNGCPFASITMTASVQATICQAFPEVSKVIAVSGL